jgi:hypothetical protein
LLAAGALGSRAPQDADPWAAVQELQFERRRDPDEPGLLARYARALGEAGDEDAEIAYLLLARDGWARLGPDLDAARRQAAATASKRLGALDASLGRVDGHVDAYLRELSQVLRLYARNQRKPRNALDVAEAVLRRQPDHGATRALVDEIAASEPSLAAQVRRLHARLGLDRSRTFLLEWEERHDAWEDAGRVTTARYDVRCDIGYDLLHRAAYVLEEAADAYAAFFGVAHAPPAPTPVNLYRTEADYLQATSQRPPREGDLAFLDGYVEWTETDDGRRIDPEFRFALHARDPRGTGLPLAELERELVLEAARQYGEVASGPFPMPPWLDAGSAAWFAGADLDDDGALRAGRVVPLRLRWLHRLLVERTEGAPDDGLERAARNAVPLLEAALARRPGDPRAPEDYGVAWGLVYFLMQERDADGDFPFRPLVQAAWRTVASGVESGRTVFDQAVLEPSGLTLQAFARRWSAAMIALYDAQEDPRGVARDLVARGERWRAEGRAAAAREAFLEALAHEPHGVAAHLGLAGLRAGSKDRSDADVTLLHARRAWRAAVRGGDEAGAEAARALAEAADPAGFKRLRAAEDAYRDRVTAVVERQLAGGRPRTALALSRLYLDDVLGDDAHAALAARLAAGGLRFTRTLALFDGWSLDGLLGPPDGVTAVDSRLVLTSARPHHVVLLGDRHVAPFSRLEGDVMLADANTLFGMTLRGDAMGLRGACLRPADDEEHPIGMPAPRHFPFDAVGYGQFADLRERLDEAHLRPALDVGEPRACPVPLLPARWIKFALDRGDPGWLSLRLDGREVARWAVPLGGDPVQPGLAVYGGTAIVRDLRVVELDRL